MRISPVVGLVSLMGLASCASAVLTPDRHTSHVPVCQEQSDWARLGTVQAGEIAISCPDHGIGDHR
ncbi:hypothetical protein [Pseudorhodobacter sp. MZDSW-24AT]|uniref:hypothetical protein n=1 Tax=Pseudorhodobacter sp. MZDSW-24AT TaxID=2052957 RepID=UPI000C1F4256|nr:hypothetical protein [Pseudorhodobacter sp. MZDSW-24AT]PJF07884.1 hypothetical protein CUR21_16855 [Pseudorhodobacter sp. MZDSW-24AT]